VYDQKVHNALLLKLGWCYKQIILIIYYAEIITKISHRHVERSRLYKSKDFYIKIGIQIKGNFGLKKEKKN
jgi:hypothetical protein